MLPLSLLLVERNKLSPSDTGGLAKILTKLLVSDDIYGQAFVPISGKDILFKCLFLELWEFLLFYSMFNVSVEIGGRGRRYKSQLNGDWYLHKLSLFWCVHSPSVYSASQQSQHFSSIVNYDSIKYLGKSFKQTTDNPWRDNSQAVTEVCTGLDHTWRLQRVSYPSLSAGTGCISSI